MLNINFSGGQQDFSSLQGSMGNIGMGSMGGATGKKKTNQLQ